ncbi:MULTISPECIES: hypothetical protein [unclassified Carboxylicivirga]|uniref:hypothetical protein n=1 Tax=Carboxylicivirga TaxID=1628153 RepID=UPI003D3550EC
MIRKILVLMVIGIVGANLTAQIPIVYKELALDPKLCWQIKNFEVVHSLSELKDIPLKYKAPCETLNYGKINFDTQSVIICSQYVRNGAEGIKSTRVEVLRNDKRKRIDVFFAAFGSAIVQRPGKVFENRKVLLLPKFPADYKVEVHYSLKVLEL